MAEFEIPPGEALQRSFDAIFDIRHNPADRLIEGARPVGYDRLVTGEELPDAGASILIVCDIGVRSKEATLALRAKGYEGALSLAGGADALRHHLASEGSEPLSASDIQRYDRQIRLANFGIEGQRRLGIGVVTVVGAGGLGCPALSYLVSAGVGTVRVIDPDTVDVSNLQRQPLYRTEDIGRSKVSAARDRLVALNPNIDVDGVETKLDDSNARGLITGSTVVIDATDTFDARYALNIATARLGIPLIYGSVYGFEGQFAAFDARSGPCYRCVFPHAPADDAALDCATIGVLGATTGVIGSLQASAALQIAAGVAHDLFGRLTMFDSRTGRFDSLAVRKRSDCPDCGQQ